MDAHVASATATRFGRREEPLEELAAEAGARALAQAGLDRPDRLLVATQFPEELGGVGNVAVLVAERLGLVGIPAVRVETGPSSGAAALHLARALVKAGEAESVLVVGAETMTRRPSAEVAGVLARMLPPDERAVGLTMPALTALMTRAYLRRHGVSREDLALAPVKAHRHGALNPDAHLRRPVTVEDVLASPLVADPLRLLDCAPTTDGAAACVVARRGPVRLAGCGQATDTHGYAARRGDASLVGFAATRAAAQAALRDARRDLRDVRYVEHHDAFSVLELANLEDLGFFPAGEAVHALRDGATSLGGRLPTNCGGGLKARGHPVGATGLAQVAEAFAQLTRAAGARQVDGADVALCHNIGAFGSNVLVTLLEGAS